MSTPIFIDNDRQKKGSERENKQRNTFFGQPDRKETEFINTNNQQGNDEYSFPATFVL